MKHKLFKRLQEQFRRLDVKLEAVITSLNSVVRHREEINAKLERLDRKSWPAQTTSEHELKRQLEQAQWREVATKDFTDRLEKSLAQERDNAKKLVETNISLDTVNSQLRAEIRKLQEQLDRSSP